MDDMPIGANLRLYFTIPKNPHFQQFKTWYQVLAAAFYSSPLEWEALPDREGMFITINAHTIFELSKNRIERRITPLKINVTDLHLYLKDYGSLQHNDE